MKREGSGSAGGNNGLGCLGSVVAAMLSIKTLGWTWWVVLHFMLSWFYVAYWVIFVWAGGSR